jgi:NhaP-type Na+/H+ or K+/H+ antiporter
VSGMPTWPVAALSLVLGFAVADVTGVRPLGGVVLVAAAAWCFARWRARAGLPRAIALVALYAAAFVASHALADVLGTWGAIAAVAAAAGAAAWVLADRLAVGARR